MGMGRLWMPICQSSRCSCAFLQFHVSTAAMYVCMALSLLFADFFFLYRSHSIPDQNPSSSSCRSPPPQIIPRRKEQNAEVAVFRSFLSRTPLAYDITWSPPLSLPTNTPLYFLPNPSGRFVWPVQIHILDFFVSIHADCQSFLKEGAY